MRAILLTGIAIALAGCATHSRVEKSAMPATASKTVVTSAATTTAVVETPYSIRAYRDPNDPAVVHQPHVVLRETRVPRALTSDRELDTLPRATIPAASFSPLPANAELAAELATQKQITSDLRTIQTNMADTQKRTEAQYGKLVSATADTLQLRQQLEAERAKVRELQAKLNEQQTSATPTVAADGDAQSKW